MRDKLKCFFGFHKKQIIPIGSSFCLEKRRMVYLVLCERNKCRYKGYESKEGE